ncbi:hypothetical protein Plhal304r1_c013g0050071 [Plasmopara halstedii]
MNFLLLLDLGGFAVCSTYTMIPCLMNVFQRLYKLVTSPEILHWKIHSNDHLRSIESSRNHLKNNELIDFSLGDFLSKLIQLSLSY